MNSEIIKDENELTKAKYPLTVLAWKDDLSPVIRSIRLPDPTFISSKSWNKKAIIQNIVDAQKENSPVHPITEIANVQISADQEALPKNKPGKKIKVKDFIDLPIIPEIEPQKIPAQKFDFTFTFRFLRFNNF